MKTSRLMVAIASALITSHAYAGLIGDSVNASLTSIWAPETVAPSSAVVVAGGPEFVWSLAVGRAINIDLQDTYITFTYNDVSGSVQDDCNNNCLLTISGIDDVITGVTVTETNTINPVFGPLVFGGNTAAFTAHSITLSIDGTWDATDSVRIDFTSRQANVPEPGSLALLGLGLAGLGALRRKRS